MTDCAVSAADVRLVTETFALAARAFGSHLGAIPSFGAAIEACARMSAAADMACLPADPVAAQSATAIGDRVWMDAYQEQDFTREEAFRMLEIMAMARAQVAAVRLASGCA